MLNKEVIFETEIFVEYKDSDIITSIGNKKCKMNVHQMDDRGGVQLLVDYDLSGKSVFPMMSHSLWFKLNPNNEIVEYCNANRIPKEAIDILEIAGVTISPDVIHTDFEYDNGNYFTTLNSLSKIIV